MKYIRTALAVIVCIGGFTVSSVEAGVELRFEPFEKGNVYLSSQREKISRTYADGKTEKISYTVNKKIKETIKEVAPGRYAKTLKQLAGSLKYLNKAKVKAHQNPEYTEQMNILGEYLPEEGIYTTPAADRIRLVFPEKEVDEGDQWVYKAAPSQAFPGVLETVYTVKEIDEKHSLAVIESSTAYKNTHTSTGVEVSVRSNGVIHFNYAKGQLLKSLTSTTVRTVYLNPLNAVKELVQTTDAKYRLAR